MKNIIFLLLLVNTCMFAQTRDVGSNPAVSVIAIDYNAFVTPSGCTSVATVVAHEINVLNPDFSIAAFAYVDLESGFTHSSDTDIVDADTNGNFNIIDASYTDYRTRVAQSCKMGCCRIAAKWTDWVYGNNGPDPCDALAIGDCSIDYDESYDIEENGAGGFDVSSVPNGTYTNADACYEYIYRGLYCLEDSKWVYITNNAVFGGPTPIPTDVLVCPIEADKTYQDIEVLKPIGFAEYWVLRGEFDIVEFCDADEIVNLFLEDDNNNTSNYNPYLLPASSSWYIGNSVEVFTSAPIGTNTMTIDLSGVTGVTNSALEITWTKNSCVSEAYIDEPGVSMNLLNLPGWSIDDAGFSTTNPIVSTQITYTDFNVLIQGELPDCDGNSNTPVIDTNDDTVSTSEAGVVSIVDVTPNDTSSDCEPITYTILNEVNCTVVNNNDGTFDVTPIAADPWSFDYTATCDDGSTNDTSTVNGDASVSNGITFAYNEAAWALLCGFFVQEATIIGLRCIKDNGISNNNGGEILVVRGGCNNLPIWIDDQSIKLKVGGTYNFRPKTGTSSAPPASNVIWDFGDGNTATGINVSHTYNLAGIYNVTISTTNCDGSLNSVVFTIEVVN